MDLSGLSETLKLPGISAFFLGIMASIGPCTLATNLAALAYISRRVSDRKFAVTSGAFYTVGRMITYTVLGMLIIYTGLSIPVVANFLQQFNEIAVGPFLIIVGIVMLFLDRISFGGGDHRLAAAARSFADKGLVGALPLGIILGLAFCPYTAVLFFMVLIPLALKTPGGVGLPAAFALGTGLPVLLFGTLLSLGIAGATRWINAISKSEIYIRTIVGVLFIIIGLFYIVLWIKPF